MSTTSGKARQLLAARTGIKFSNLAEFRGQTWEAITDYFFGYTSVDLDWSDTADSTRFNRWVYTSDGTGIDNQVTVIPTVHRVELESIAGTSDGTSNERDLFTIPETASWGIAHAQCEIYGGPKFLAGTTSDENQLHVVPQHGIGLRAQEDGDKRRTIIAWHDVAFALPQTINLGVWSGNLDGTGFTNRQANLAMDLDENYVVTAASRVNDDDSGLIFDGTVATWATPDTASLDITGDWWAKFDMTPVDWTPSVFMSIWSKFLSTGNQRSYRWRLTNLGEIEITTSNDGIASKSFKTDAAATAILAALPNGTRKSIAIDFDADNGAAGATATFWIADNYQGPYTQLGAAVTVAGTVSEFVGTSVGEIGAVNNGAVDRFIGRIHRLELRPGRLADSPPQPAAVDVRPHVEDNGVTSFTDNVGLVFTRTGTASLENTQRGIATATIGTHALIVGDRVNVNVGEELSVTGLQRTGGAACQCTLPGGHNIETGSFCRLLFSSDSSFDGTFYVTVSGNTMTWTDAGANISGHTSILWDYTWRHMTATIVGVGATTVDYESPGKAKATIPVTGNSRLFREFPYYMETRVQGPVAMVRCWGRHQTVPDWMDQDRALITDLTKASQVYSVTDASRSANVATLTIGAHDLIIGERISISAMTDATFNATNRIVTAIAPTQFSYANPGSDVASGPTGTATRMGSGTAATIISNPCPTGSGRIAFVGAHIGNNTLSRCAYGPFFGDNDFDSKIIAGVTSPDVGQALETETAQTIGKAKTYLITQAIETETAGTLTKTKTKATTVATETETAQTVTRIKTASPAQVTETETAGTLTKTKLRLLTQSVETETAQTLAKLKARLTVQALETETANALTSGTIVTIVQAVETETAGVITRFKSKATTQATETETAQALTKAKVRVPTQAIETETAGLITKVKTKLTGQASEVETAGVLVRVKQLALVGVIETETAGVLIFVIPPDPNPILISFTEGRNGLVSFDGRVGMVIFEEPA